MGLVFEQHTEDHCFVLVWLVKLILLAGLQINDTQTKTKEKLCEYILVRSKKSIASLFRFFYSYVAVCVSKHYLPLQSQSLEPSPGVSLRLTSSMALVSKERRLRSVARAADVARALCWLGAKQPAAPVFPFLTRAA